MRCTEVQVGVNTKYGVLYGISYFFFFCTVLLCIGCDLAMFPPRVLLVLVFCAVWVHVSAVRRYDPCGSTVFMRVDHLGCAAL